MPYFSHDDIAQIGTPPGAALLGALRLSGENAFAILAKTSIGIEPELFRNPERCVRDCMFLLELTGRGEARSTPATHACPARALVMPGPASYTREDVAEIHLPGSPALLQAGLRSLVAAGARAAAPGEFTFRAFRNGRISLGQAEAVEAVIRAGHAEERRAALARMGDRGRTKALAWLDAAMDIVARLEAALDFSEEELDEAVAGDLQQMLAGLIREGVEKRAAAMPRLPHLALVGLANAGKSSLFNALLGDAAAIVSGVASTTRDSLRREVEWQGTRLLVSDNPGYHPEGDDGGRLAADRAFATLGGEEVACWVVDGTRLLGAREHDFIQALPSRLIVAVNKADLPRAVSAAAAARFAAAAGRRVVAALEVSAASGDGVAALRETLAEVMRGESASEAWSSREAWELGNALSGCRDAADELAGAARLELAADDMRRAVSSFSRVLGIGYADDALARIFSGFCIGK